MEYLYVLSNKSMPNIIKVGFTTRSLDERLAELNSSTSVPSRFKVEYFVEVSDGMSYNVEQKVHSALKAMGHHHGKEFFKCSVGECKKVICEIINNLKIDAVDSESKAREKEYEKFKRKKEEERQLKISQEIALINEKYRKLLIDASNGGHFFVWWAPSTLIIGLVWGGSLNAKTNSYWVTAAFLGALVAGAIINIVEERKKKSKEYQLLLKKNKEEVGAVEKKYR